MKNSTFTIEEIKRLESLSSEEVIRSFKEYDAYTTNSLSLLTNVTTIDKAIYVGIMLKSMKAKEVCEKTGLTKSHVSRLGKVGKWALSNKEQYKKLIDTAGTALSVRAIADAITHDTIKGVDDWASLIEAENAYKSSVKTTPTTSTKANQDTQDKKPSSDRRAPKQAMPKHSFKIVDFERMNSTSMYSAVIRMVDAYKASGDNLDYMESFIERLNTLKH